MRKRLLSMVLALGIVMTLAVVPASATGTASMMNFEEKRSYTEGQFTDVKAADWFSAGVQAMYEYGLMNGTSGNKFSPEKSITAAEISLLMARLADIYSGGTGEISGDWQTQGKNYLDEKNLAIDLHANADGTVARAYVMGQLVKILPASEFAAINTIEKLPDVDGNTPYSAEILMLYNAGILTGGDKYGTFSPDKVISRGELATLLVRVIDGSTRKTFTPESSALEGYTGVGVNYEWSYNREDPWANLPNTKLVADKYGFDIGNDGFSDYIYLDDGSVSMSVSSYSKSITIKGFDYSANLPSKYEATCALIRDTCDKESADALIKWISEANDIVSDYWNGVNIDENRIEEKLRNCPSKFGNVSVKLIYTERGVMDGFQISKA